MKKVLFVGGYGGELYTLIAALLRKDLSYFCDTESEIKAAMRESEADCITHIVYGKERQKRCSANLSLVLETPIQAEGLCFSITRVTYHEIIREVRKSNAIVYIMSAIMPFMSEDRFFIKKYLSNCNRGNIFFCVTNMRGYPKENVVLLKKRTEEMLKPYFILNGVFNEKLYHSRIFFVDAYSSLCARRGKPVRTLYGDIMAQDINTGIPEFEYTLRKYLQRQDIKRQ